MAARSISQTNSVAEIMFYDLHAMQIVKQTWELIAVLGGRSLTTLNWRALFWIPVRFAQCDWMHSLCCLTVVASYLCSAGLIYETQHNFDLQQTTMLHVMLICEPKEIISSAFLKHGEKN